MRNLFLLCALTVALPCLAENPAEGTAARPYALASPAVSAALTKTIGTPDALAVIKSARNALLQPPHPLPHIHVEGTLPHQGIYDQSRMALKDIDIMLDLALAWRVTKEPSFLQALTVYFKAWLETYQPDFNPIDETHFDQFILAYDLAGADLPLETQAKMKAFLATVADAYLTPRPNDRGSNVNNWQSHRVKLGTLAAFALGNPARIERAHQAFLQQIAVNLQPDGSVLDFHERDALHYVTYDLEPLTMTVLAAKAHGLDWFHATTPQGASLSGSLDWLAPFATGEKSHVEFVHSTVGFDAARAKAGVPGFTGNWKPENAAGLFTLAAQLDPKYQPVANKLAHAGNGSHVPHWMRLLIDAGF